MPQGRPKTGNHTKMMINFTEEIANELKKRSEVGGLPISYQVIQDLKERMFNRNMEQYDKYCDDYEENQDTETLANIEKYEDRLKYFIKK